MPRHADRIMLSEEERSTLQKWLRSPSQEQRMVERARIVLMGADGMENKSIAAELDIPEMKVGRWRKRFAENGLDGLRDEARTGRKRIYGHDERLQLVNEILRPPEKETHWSTRRLSGLFSKYGDVLSLPF